MKKIPPGTTPDDYVDMLGGWQRDLVESIRSRIRESSVLEENIKWGHLVYLYSGPVCLLRAEEARVLFGFWRGQRLREIEPRLKPGGKYEMATMELREGDTVDGPVVIRLVREAVALNNREGDPTGRQPR